MNKNYRDHYNYDISIFDWLKMMKGVPPSNTKILLKVMVAEKAPTDMIRALLARMSSELARDAVPDLAALIQGDDKALSSEAMETLAFIPAQAGAIRDLKQNLFESGSIADVISAGTDFRLDAVEHVGAVSGRAVDELRK